MVLSLPLKALPLEERPRERLLRLGPEKLATHELLAILLRTGVPNCSVVDLAKELLHHCEQRAPGAALRYLTDLQSSEVKSLMPGLGDVKIAQVLAGLHLGRRAVGQELRQVDLSNPRAVYEYLAPRIALLQQEEFHVVLLNAKNRVLDQVVVTGGTLTASLVHPREIFRSAIRRGAHAVILAHNHPSGDPTPSREDREVTLRLIQAGKVIGIEVLDHLVIGDGRYFSFRERGLVEFS